MKTILVPTDFSPAAGNACEYAGSFAKEMNANILLLHVYQIPVTVSELQPIEINQEEIQKAKEEELKNPATYLSIKNNIEVKYIVRAGFIIDELLAEEKHASIIVTGIKGAGEPAETLIGSITTELLRKVKIPVLVIPGNATYKTPEKIVFACDYDSRTTIHTLDALKMLIKSFNSKLYVVNVKQKGESNSVDETMAEMKLENGLTDVEHVYYFPENESLVECINEFVEENQVNMVAVIPHRHNLIERLFHQSISKKIAFHTHVPLLALPDDHKSVPVYFV